MQAPMSFQAYPLQWRAGAAGEMNEPDDIRRRDEAKLRAMKRVATINTAKILEKPCGFRAKYVAGCRCLLCRAANSRYSVMRDRECRAGNGNPLVSAEWAQLRMQNLTRAGVGRRAIAAATDISDTILQEIRSGRRLKIRKSTQDRILGMTVEAASDRAYIPARQAWRQINALMAEGFSKSELARRLGLKSPSIQFKQDRMTAKNVSKVDKFYQMVMAEGEDLG